MNANNVRSGTIRPTSRLLLIALLPLLLACATGPEDDIDTPGAGMVHLAVQMQQRGDNVGALNFYMRALQHDATNVAAWKGSAAMLEKMGDIPAAVEQMRGAVRIKPRDGALRRELGRLLLAQDQPAEAREQYEEALGIDRRDMKAKSGLGVAYDYLGDHKAAQKQYEAVLEREPDNLGTINNLAYSTILTGDYVKAIALLEPVVKKPTATPALRQNLALAYGMAGMEIDAARIAKIDLSPKQVKANLDYYKRKRAELKVSQTPYAVLGTYATEDMAKAEIVRLQPKIGKKAAGLKPVVLPEISAPGGTPRFTVRMMGCNKPEEVDHLCDTLTPLGIPCVAHNNGQ